MAQERAGGNPGGMTTKGGRGARGRLSTDKVGKAEYDDTPSAQLVSGIDSTVRFGPVPARRRGAIAATSSSCRAARA